MKNRMMEEANVVTGLATNRMCIDAIRQTFERDGEQPFLIEAEMDRVFSRREFFAVSARFGEAFREAGVRPGDRIAIVLGNTAEFCACFFGCLLFGATAVLVNPGLHPQEVRFILENTGVRLVVFSLCTRALVLSAKTPVSCGHLFLIAGQERDMTEESGFGIDLDAARQFQVKDWQPFASSFDEMALTIAFTSGTMNLPKGVVHSVRSLFGNAAAFNEFMGFGPHSRFLNVWPMAYSSGFLNNLIGAFQCGGSLVMGRVFDPQAALQFWRPALAYIPSVIWLSPAMAAALVRVDRDPAGPAFCREHRPVICIGTAPLSEGNQKAFEGKYGVPVYESYGLSELLIISGNTPGSPGVPGTVGRCLPGVTARLGKSDADHPGDGRQGEILVKTPWLMKGYLDYSTLQPEPMSRDGEFPTGDIGRVDPEGRLAIVGRKKALIIRGGLNISPVKIEEVIRQHPAVEKVRVVGIPHELAGEEIVALVRLREGYRLDEERVGILKRCRDGLSNVSVPNYLLEFPEASGEDPDKVPFQEIRERVKSLMKR
jgi:long-chain acyl-CoA synthetase